MNVVSLAQYSDKYTNPEMAMVSQPCDQISLEEIRVCVSYLQKQAKKAGFGEVADLLAVVNMATFDMDN